MSQSQIPAAPPPVYLDLLEQPIAATLATSNPDGSPHTSVIWRVWEPPFVWFMTDPASRKGRNLLRDPRLSLMVIDPHDSDRYLALVGVIAGRTPDPQGLFSDRVYTFYEGEPLYAGRVPEAVRPTLWVWRIHPLRWVANSY